MLFFALRIIPYICTYMINDVVSHPELKNAVPKQPDPVMVVA
jgi:hypothetical protein